MATPSRSLLSLPPEILYEIADYLPPEGILALKLAHPVLHHTFLLPRFENTVPSDCTRFAIREYLADKKSRTSTIRCLLCKKTYPQSMFSTSESFACKQLYKSDGRLAEVIQYPKRVCSWHVGLLTRVIRANAGGRDEWTSTMGKWCMHCGRIRDWNECTCECNSCPVIPIRTYTRYMSNNMEWKNFRFRREVPVENESGWTENLFVEEKYCTKASG
ncbi:hypothetical protein CC78DRAFT_539508 [Lojkania enalia]|uniref:F-box domain-containing protein n=1 Tax=Lojkania enalia TaxID=147567 RepID=A0A9P4NBN7_9PLEO|nr:hypothetical protein CC78DRAFT_539508 [Didymosphaeria enalia]